jgi:hypothetical protein
LLLARQQLRDDGVPAAAGIAQHEQVVAVVTDVEAELHGIHRARMQLADIDIGQRLGRGEIERGRIAG